MKVEISRQGPVPAPPRFCGGERQRSGGRQPRDALERGRGRVPVHAEQKEISDGEIVQIVGNRRVKANAGQRIAEHEEVPTLRIVEGLHAEVVPGAKDPTLSPIPDGEREVPDQVIDAVVAPRMISVQDELRVVGELGARATLRLELRDQIGPRVDARVGREPDVAVETERLTFSLGLPGSSQHRVAESDRAVAPNLLRVGPAIRHEVGHSPQQFAIDRRAVQVDDPHDPTHRPARPGPAWAAPLSAA